MTFSLKDTPVSYTAFLEYTHFSSSYQVICKRTLSEVTLFWVLFPVTVGTLWKLGPQPWILQFLFKTSPLVKLSFLITASAIIPMLVIDQPQTYLQLCDKMYVENAST